MKKKSILFKVIKVILVSFVIFMIGAISLFKWIDATNTKVHASKEIKLTSAASDKKALIIYQPARTNITKDIAMAIGDTLNKSGYEVTINYPSEEISKDLSDYKVIVFGTPIYFDKYSVVLEKYMKSIKDYTGKKVMVFGTGGIKEKTKAISDLEAIVSSASKVKSLKLIKGETSVATAGIAELIKE